MIRAVRVTGVDGEDDGEALLGFWDTVSDKFLAFSGMTLFASREDWEAWVRHSTERTQDDIDRCRRLIPTWVPEKSDDD